MRPRLTGDQCGITYMVNVHGGENFPINEGKPLSIESAEALLRRKSATGKAYQPGGTGRERRLLVPSSRLSLTLNVS